MKKYVLFFIIISLNMILFFIFSEKVYAAVDPNIKEMMKADKEKIPNVDDVLPFITPTPKPTIVFGALMSAGYKRQPERETYAKIGESVTLYTDSDRSAFSVWSNWFARPKYQWFYRPLYDKRWYLVPDDEGGKGKNLTINFDVVRTRFYQQRVNWGTTAIYSNVSLVSFSPEDIDATSIKAGIDDNYLYNLKNNNSSIYAHAELTPHDSTSKITWSGSDDSLATVDSETGLVTANNNEKNGNLTITATAKNIADGKSISDSFNVEVGGGLESQKVKSGRSATFSIKGNIDDKSTTITWYKIKNDKKIQVSNSGINYTTPPTKLVDDGTKYYAVIKVNDRSTSQVTTTNEATLNVQAVGKPNINLVSTIVNQTYPESTGNNFSTLLNDVVTGDELTLETRISNDSTESSLQDASFVLNLYKNMTIQQVLVDGKIISDYNFQDNKLRIDKLNFLGLEIHEIKVNVKMSNTSKDSFATFPLVSGTDSDGNPYQNSGQTLTINTLSNVLKIIPHNIDFGVQGLVQKDKVVDRVNHNDDSDPIVEIDDQRRQEKEVKLFVHQEGSFRNVDDNKVVLPASLKYYHADGKTADLATEDVQVAVPENGSRYKFIYWKKNEGLKLKFNSSVVKAGKYKVTLTWTDVNSPV